MGGGFDGSGLRLVRRFRFSVVGGFEECSGSAVFGFWFAGVVSAALVLLALRALPCVTLRCPAFVLCVPVGMS